jgi:caa(3)-type oxidase subunit IV
MEYSTYVFDFGGLGIPLLVVLIVIKFILVASWFMHLKFDTKLFSRFMYGGLVLAFVLYALTLVIMLFDGATGVEYPTTDPRPTTTTTSRIRGAMKTEFRNRVFLPVIMPVAILLALAFIGTSR